MVQHSGLRALALVATLAFPALASAAAPTVSTSSATSVAATSASLNGVITPNGESTVGWFRRATTSPGTCNDTFGTRVPSAGGTGVGSGTTATPYQVADTGLLPGTTYYYCAIAENASAKVFGAIVTFTTPALSPTVSTSAATNVTSSSAELNGTTNPNGAETTGWFRYNTSSPGSCNNTFGFRFPATGGAALGSGNGALNFKETVPGLLSGVTYYYCAISQNAAGISYGNVLSFTTLVAPPTVTTVSATNFTSGTQATLNGNFNANGSSTAGWFRYSSSNPGSCNDAFGTVTPSSGFSTSTNFNFARTITGLTPGTTYYYCAIAQNSVGIGFGAVQTFTLPSAPVVDTLAATNVAATTATLNSTVNPGQLASTLYFGYSSTNPTNCQWLYSNGVWSGGSNVPAGSSAVPVANNVAGLLPGTTYYYCAFASNSVGTTYGNVMALVTLPLAPTVSTSSVINVTGTTVTLRGSSVPRGASTTGWFRYATTHPGSCNDTFGTRAPTSGGAALGSGNTTVPFTEDVAGLTPGTTYYYCAIAENSVGKAFGAVSNFTTHDVPFVQTNAADAFTSGVQARLNGYMVSNGGSTTGWFRYAPTNPGTCNDSFGTRAPTTGGTVTSGSLNFNRIVTGLTPGTTYYFCAIAENAVGTAFGDVESFTLPTVSIVDTLAATNVAATIATLNATVNPGGTSATAYFAYSTTNPTNCQWLENNGSYTSLFNVSTGTAAVPVARSTGSLLPGTTYYYCAFAYNSVGTGYGAVLNFTTPPTAPIISTNSATGVTGTSATLNGTVNPRGAATTAWFRLVATTSPGTCNDTFGTRVPGTGGAAFGATNGNQSYNEALTSLTPGTTYYFCAIAQNSAGTSFGNVFSFATPNVPTVTTVSAINYTSGIQATLNGNFNANGVSTTGRFRYSSTSPGTCDDTFGTVTPNSGASTSSSFNFARTITGLTPGTTYYYCAIASNAVGTGFGALESFTLPALPVVTTLAASSVGASTATLNASAVTAGATATGYFRFSTTNPVTCSDTFGTRAPSSGGTALISSPNPQGYSVIQANLLPGVTYYFCALANNSVGTGVGAVLSFTTPPLAPSVVTSTVTGITSGGATLRGSTNPNGAATSGWFRYSTTSPGTCNDSFGIRVPATGGTALGGGNSNVLHTEAVTGLSLATTYYYCAIAENSVGKSFGGVVGFTTAPAEPSITTLAVSNVTTSAAQLNASVNPNGAATTGWFRYATVNPTTCNDTFGIRAPSSGGNTVGAGTSPTTYSLTPATLASGTTYYYCAIASNSAGTSFGAVLSFTTVATPPVVNTLAATSINGTSANLNGSVNPSGAATTGWFRYATTSPGTCNDTFGTRFPSTGGQALGAAPGAVPLTLTPSTLTPGATYYFCAIAENAAGKTLGQVLSFSTPASPLVTTGVASPVSATTATLNASANPNGGTATGWFRFSSTSPGTCNDTFGTRMPATGGTALGSGGAAVNYQQALSGLSPGTNYYYCAIASNLVGVSFGDLLSFTTPPTAPTVITSAPTLVTGTSATLNAQANPNGAATGGWFRYATVNPGSCNDSFGTRAPATGSVSVGSGSTGTTFAQAVTGLTPGATYYFCAIGQNSVGATFGGILSFATPNVPLVTTAAVSAPTATSATLNGTANPRGSEATAYFRYATANPGSCNDTFGTRAPSTGGVSVGSGSTAVSFNQPITGLTMGTTYYVCALATNVVGLGVGTVQSFTTPTVPTVTTLAPSTFASTTATLTSTVNPNGLASTAYFRYGPTNPGTCNDTFGSRAPTSGGTALSATTTPQNDARSIAGLIAGTTYYYCALATNSAGTAFGSVLSFTTTAPPTVVTLPATGVVANSATLNGTANPNQVTTNGWFRYWTSNPGSCSDSTTGVRAPTSGSHPLGAGSSAAPYSQVTGTLTAGITYYYCAIASSTLGTRFGALETFTTPAPPQVTTVAATLVTGTGAQLNGTADPRGLSTTGWFRYGTTSPGSCNDTFGTRVPVAPGGTAVGAGGTPVPYSEPLAGLTPQTTYYFCAIAQNSAGTTVGSVMSFFTPSTPTATTSAATVVTASSAQLNGSGNPRGAATTGYFRYGTTNPGTCTDTYGTRWPVTGGSSLGSGTTAVSYSQSLTGLASGTTYYYCAAATNVEGTGFGGVQTFSTLQGPAVTTAPATGVAGTTATLHGAANPNGTATSGWFRRWPSNPGTCTDVGGVRVPGTGSTALGSGTSPVTYSNSTTGLLSGTTYWYCALASNSVGTAVGALETFTTASLPTVTTVAATSVGSGSAQLNGSANPNNGNTTGFFRYSTVNPGSCSTTFGTRWPGTGGVALGSGSTEVPYDLALTGLQPATTYWYCAQASNTLGTGLGALMSFTTPASPNVTTSAATLVTQSSAQLNGAANPQGTAATGWFRYSATNPGTCNDTFGFRAPATGGAALGSGNTAVTYNQALSNLSTGTTYYFCAIASNTVGTSFGAVLSFSTPGIPAVTTTAATNVGGTSATLNGTGNPNGAAATGYVRYANANPGSCNDTFGTRAPTTGGTSLGAGSTAVAFGHTVSGLSPGTTYWFCALASNAVGTANGTLLTFTTASAPTVSTLTPTGLTATGATLRGTANPNSAAATGWFRYSATNPVTCSDLFGSRLPATGGTALGSGNTPVAFSQAASGLSPGGTYYYCALASNAVGLTVGTVQQFTTPASAPTVTTAAASGVSANAATLNGSANPNGGNTTGWFRYSPTNPGTCNDGFGVRAPTSGGAALGSGNTASAYSQPLAGLVAGTTYYFCALASNSAGTSSGQVQSFTTPGAPTVVTSPASNLASTSATLNGTAVANNAASTAWFRYATTNPGSCNDTFGVRAPTSGGTSVGSGTAAVAYAQPVNGLAPATTYFYCAIAQNAVGTSVGAVHTFRTLGLPAVTTSPATLLSSISARLNASANPNGATTTGWFRFATTHPGSCNDGFGVRAPAVGGTALGGGTSAAAYNQVLNDLSPGVTYYYCAIAQNQVGTAFGQVVAFQPEAPPPTVTTLAATDVGSRAAIVHGTANPNRSATTAWFRYDTTDPGTCNDTFGTKVPEDGFALGTGLSSVPFELALEGLKPALTYYYCAIGGNLGGAGFGEVRTFTTGTEAPTVKTEPALVLGDGSVTLNGFGQTNGLTGSAWFRYDTTDPLFCNFTFGQQAPPGGIELSGHDETAFTYSVRGLAPGKYFFCAIVSTTVGTAYGGVSTFEIPDGAGEGGCGCSAGEGNGGLTALLLGFGVLAWAARRRRTVS